MLYLRNINVQMLTLALTKWSDAGRILHQLPLQVGSSRAWKHASFLVISLLSSQFEFLPVMVEAKGGELLRHVQGEFK